MLFIYSALILSLLHFVSETTQELNLTVTLPTQNNSINGTQAPKISKDIIVETQIEANKISQSSVSIEDSQIIVQRQAWANRTKLVSFQNTIQTFPNLKDSIKAERLIKFIQDGSCLFGGNQPYRCAILNNKFYIYGNTIKEPRAGVINNTFKRILKDHKFPDVYFFLFHDDNIPWKYQKKERENCVDMPMFMFNKNVQHLIEKNKFLFPDVYILENWQTDINEVKKASKQYPWDKKIPKIYFIGGPTGHGPYIRNDTDFNKYYHRGALVMMSLKNPDIIHARITKNGTDLAKQLFRRSGNNLSVFSNYKSITEHISHKYLLSVDGYASAWKRPCFILLSNSVLFKTDSPNMQWFYDKLVPGENYVQIKDDLSNLFSKRENLQKDPIRAIKMSGKGNDLGEKFLTVEAIDNYIIETIKKYAKIQELNLTEEEKGRVEKGEDIQDLLVKKYQGGNQKQNSKVKVQNVIKEEVKNSK